MANKPGIDFRQVRDLFENLDLDRTIPFSEVEPLSMSSHNRKLSTAKRIRTKSKSEEDLLLQNLTVTHSFPLSIALINLLRDPRLTDDLHDFHPQYLADLNSLFRWVNPQQKHTYDEMTLYIHLILAQVDNLNEMVEFGAQAASICKFNTALWNQINLMNAKCILASLEHTPTPDPQTKQPLPENHGMHCDILEIRDTYLFEDNTLRISQNYLQLALDSCGHLDIYLGPLLLDKFTFEASLWFNNFSNHEQALHNYGKIFTQIAKQAREFESVDFPQWYADQTARIVHHPLHQPEDLVTFLNFTHDHPLIEKLLIALQGWKGFSDEAVKLLNVFYDNCDWQLHSQYNSVVAVVQDPFRINYLIEKNKRQRETLLFGLKTPCASPHYHGEVFSWHKPKLVEYLSDDESYVWVQMKLGTFAKSGFYDWALFNLSDNGKEIVNKILDIGTKHKLEKSMSLSYLKDTLLSVQSIKGRFVVQPRDTRELCLHEISIDSLKSDQGAFRNPSFLDAIEQIQRCKDLGINCVYLMGVFERDNEESLEVYRKPYASPIALTHRTVPCRMLGGKQQFSQLMTKAHQLGMKVVVDVTTRVSSSRMSKKYESLRLRSIDQQGRLIYHYGSNGRSISYEDTAALNYRKKQAWDLLIAQILTIIEQYHVDGIYLDNGFEWPQLYKINQDEMYRKEYEEGKAAYTDDQILEGEVIVNNKITGFWGSKVYQQYPNPLLVKLCKTVWQKHPHVHIIAEGLQIEDYDTRLTTIIRSGPIPRMFKLPKALSQVVGVQLQNSGQLTTALPKNINNLKKWYDQVLKSLPNQAILINSTTSPVWPYPAYIFKKATWAVVDLFFFLPNLTMTSGLQQFGRAYKTKSINFNYMLAVVDSDKKDTHEMVGHRQKTFLRANSSFFQEDNAKIKKGDIIHCSSTLIKDPSQILYLEQNFRKDVGPEFGFDLNEIHKHYQHRRQLRRDLPLLREGRLLLLQAEHLYGVHNNVLSFARYDQHELLLISINFNYDAIDMHYNLTPLKSLFKNHERADTVLKIDDVLNPDKFKDDYYLVGELLTSKIEARIEPYKTIIWKLSVVQQNKLAQAFACSRLRMQERLGRTPPAWIYSSIFFNELSHLLNTARTKFGIVSGLNLLYNEFILPAQLNFTLVITKYYDFYINKHKLEKLFGVFKLITDSPHLQTALHTHINSMLTSNTLGPIAFVTPQIGKWSSVGGLGVMVDELARELVRLGEEVYIMTPYYQQNKKKETNYLQRDGFIYERNITVRAAHFEHQFGIHRGKYCGVNYIWFHNSDLFHKPYDGEGAAFVTKQMVFFALITLQAFCQLKIFPSICVTNDWMCGFVSAYVKSGKYKEVFNGTKFMHICHNLDPLYEGRLYPKFEEGNLNWLVQLAPEWYVEYRANKLVINPSRCALQTCDNWGTVSHSYKHDLLKESPLASVLWKHPHPFSFPNGIRKQERLSILRSNTPNDHLKSKTILQQKYFKCADLKNEVPLLAFIGRITKQKGVHLILDCIEPILYEYNFNVQFLVGGSADSKQEYGKMCAEKMKYLTYKYPHCVWSSPDTFFSDGPLVNIGSDYSMMPSLFEPGGIVQHEFFCGGTPVIAFRTGGLKDTVFEFDPKTLKGNGFNFMSYDHEDFKRCMRRALECYKNRPAYEKLRQNAFESVIEQEDVAKGWNNEFYRMQNKIYIDWLKVDNETKKFDRSQDESEEPEDVGLLQFSSGEYWQPEWDNIERFKEVLKNASRLKLKSHTFRFESKKIPRPKEIFICGNWDEWKTQTKLIFDKIKKNYKVSLKLRPGSYMYKYIDDGEWILTENQEKEVDINNNENHIVTVE